MSLVRGQGATVIVVHLENLQNIPGHIVRLDKAQGFSKICPTKTFSKKLSLELAGLELEFLHAPGETDDQIVVWYPAKRVLFPADNIYRAFPNL